MPSRDEGFGLVFLEAMRAGKACIGARGAAAEIIEHERDRTGRRSGSRDDLAAAVVTALRRARHVPPIWRRRARALSVDLYRCLLSGTLCAGRSTAACRAPYSVMNILGLNAYHGDVSAVLVRDGRLIAAIEEERFRRIKHVAGFPRTRDRRVSAHGQGSTARDVDLFAVSRSPRAHLWRKALFLLQHRPKRTIGDRAAQRREHRPAVRHDRRVGRPRRVRASGRGCATSSIIPRTSPAPRSSARSTTRPCVRLTGSATSSARRGDGWTASAVHVDRRVFFPHSLGLLYLAVTQYLGLSQLRRRVQGDGPRAVRRAALRRARSSRWSSFATAAFELDLSYFSHWSDGVR